MNNRSPCVSCKRADEDKNECARRCKRLDAFNRGQDWKDLSDGICSNCKERIATDDDGLCGWCRGAMKRKKKRISSDSPPVEPEKTELIMAEKEQLDILRKEAREWSNRMTAIEQRLNALKARCEGLESLLCHHEHDHLGRAGLFMATEEALKKLAGEVKRG